jgi:hypothetical protein
MLLTGLTCSRLHVAPRKHRHLSFDRMFDIMQTLGLSKSSLIVSMLSSFAAGCISFHSHFGRYTPGSDLAALYCSV